MENLYEILSYQFTNYALDARNNSYSTIYLNMMFWIVKNSCICTNKNLPRISSSLKWDIIMSNCVSNHMKEKQHIILQFYQRDFLFGTQLSQNKIIMTAKIDMLQL